MIDKFRGTGVALVTPFTDKNVDHDALRRIVNHVIDGGVDYLVALGTTGESALLTDDEKLEVLQTIIDENNSRVPVVAGNFGGNNTKRLQRYIEEFNFTGIDAILSASPAYVKPSQEGIYRHYMELAEAAPVPIIIYNVPGRTASNITTSTMVRLAEASDKFIGVKEASGDLVQGTEMIQKVPKNFFVTSGDDPTALPLIACGSTGVISVIANAFPHIFSSMIGAALDNDYVTARKLNKQLYDIHKWLYVEGNPVGIKAAMQILGICHRDVRLPLAAMSDEHYLKLEEAIGLVN